MSLSVQWVVRRAALGEAIAERRADGHVPPPDVARVPEQGIRNTRQRWASKVQKWLRECDVQQLVEDSRASPSTGDIQPPVVSAGAGNVREP